MRLDALVRLYVQSRNAQRPIGRELADKSVQHLAECVRALSRYLCRPSVVTDLQADAMHAFLAATIEDGCSPFTAKSRRSGLLVLWRFAHRAGMAERCEGVRTVYCPQLVIDGYDVSRMERLIVHVATLTGVVRRTGIPKHIYWDSFLRTDWRVGLRIGDMLRVHSNQFDSDGWLWTHESKTGKAGWRRLDETTTASIRRCLGTSPERELIWPGYTQRNICRAFSLLAKSAGVGGTSKFIRSGGSSECDRLHPGNGWRHLRHSSPTVWERHYRVDRIVAKSMPAPPPLP